MKYIYTIMGLGIGLIMLAVLSLPDGNLHIIACNVGQGDATLIERGSAQILIDGGPDNDVLSCLGKYMPFWDRKIEIVVLSHPQKDHFEGLIEVFKQYNVDYFVASSLENVTPDYQVLKEVVGSGGVRVVSPDVGKKLSVNSIYLDIVYPTLAMTEDKKVLGEYVTNDDPNEYSVILNLKYEGFDGIFTGDIGPKESAEIVDSGRLRDVEYIKVPHHGSKNGLTEALLIATAPEVATISVGKNQWGHPHKEVLDMLGKYNVKIYRTDQEGNIEIVSDGKKWWTIGE